MATVVTSAPPQGERLILSGINWQTYSRLLHALGEQPGVFLTYDRGEIEIMSPLRTHEKIGLLLSRIIVTLTEELNLPIDESGSTTLRRRKKQRGLEPDDCFWI